MKKPNAWVGLAVVTMAVGLAAAGAMGAPPGSLEQRAVAEDAAVSGKAIAALRAQGPAGLEALLAAHAAEIRKHEGTTNGMATAKETAAWARLKAALAGVSGQRDCQASRLYWYTDLEQAKAAAKASGKPILSLRLLGKLDEEYSCANSRFFRTTLYANTEVSEYLRTHFILHWKSERPVPRITIDFGDGRKIERTVTGNSIHYVLNAEGEPIDALPGLYGAKAFLRGLKDGEEAVRKSTALANYGEKENYLEQYHRAQMAAITAAWQKDMATIGAEAVVMPRTAQGGLAAQVTPTALVAGDVTASKRPAERPMLTSFQPTDDATWVKIAALHQEDGAMDAAAQKLIYSKNPTAYEAGRAAFSKSMVESPFVSMMRNLQRSIAEDTMRNEYSMHFRIHQWFVNGSMPRNLERLNTRVYAELFLTPRSDPWLGLVPPNTFTGLDNNGLVAPSVGW
jgi:hypothetical protein